MKRLLPVFVTLALCVICAPSAFAADSSSSTSTSTPPTTTTTTTTETPPPATTTTTTDTPPTTTATTTATPTTTTTTTDTPVTTTTTVPPTTTTTDGDGTTCDDDCVPTDVANVCDDATCIPTSADGIPSAVTGTGTTGALPFTGVADMIAPILLALTVLIGGVVAWRWAQLRESVARDADRAIETPVRAPHTGYEQSLRRAAIEGRARALFQPRVA